MTPFLATLVLTPIDRSVPPPVAPAPLLDQPAPETFALTDAVTVHLVTIPGLRKVAIDGRVQAGSTALAGGPTEATRALGWILDAATQDVDGTELDILGDTLDMDLWSEFDHDDAGVYLRIPREHLATGVGHWGDVLLRPDLPRADLRLFQRDLETFYEVEGPTSPSRLARAALTHAWFPSDSPFGRRPDLGALDAVKRSDLFALHERWLGIAPIEVLVVGDVVRADIEPLLLAAIGDAGIPGEVAATPAPSSPADRVVAIDVKGQEQVAIRWRTSFPEASHPDAVAARSVSWALGGHFLSRLNKNLREDKGYTYGAGARWSDLPGRGSLTVEVDVPTEFAAETVEEIRKELAALGSDGLTVSERDDAALAARQAHNETRQNAESAVGWYAAWMERGSSAAAAKAQVAAMATLDPAATRTFAARWLGEDGPQVWVFVGDRTTLEPELAQAGLTAMWVDPDDAILGVLP